MGTTALIRDRELVQATVGPDPGSAWRSKSVLIEAMTELMAADDAGGDRLV